MDLQRVTESFPGRVGRKFMEDRAPNGAVLIAWNGLFAMFPIALFMAAILGLVLHVAGFQAQAFYDQVVAVVPDPAVQREVLEALESVRRQSGLLFVVGLAGLLWGGASLFGAMEEAFAVIYHTTPRDFVRQKLMGFGMVLLFTVLAGLAVGTSSLLPVLKHLPNIPDALTGGPLALALQLLLGALAGIVLFSAIYFVVPTRPRAQPLRQVAPGALVAGVLFEVITLVFPLYLAINRGINAYGKTFALFFVLLTFFYLLGLVTMLGAELNAVLYPVAIPQPGREPLVLPALGSEEAVRPVAAGREGWPAGVAALVALGASLLGFLLRRRLRGAR